MTSPPLLRKEHKNDIFRAIQAVGLDPNEFDLEDFADGVRIKHKRSESYFIVGRDESGYYVGKSLVGDGLVWPTSPASWQTLMPRISWWLEEVKQDLDTPDLWAELKREAQLLGADSSVVTENTAFTVDEQREIARRLKELGTSDLGVGATRCKCCMVEIGSGGSGGRRASSRRPPRAPPVGGCDRASLRLEWSFVGPRHRRAQRRARRRSQFG
jgi:hypothetical protein